MTENLEESIVQLTSLVDQIVTELKVLRKDRKDLRAALQWYLESVPTENAYLAPGDRWKIEDLLKRTEH